MNLAANKCFWTRLGHRSLAQPTQAVLGNALSINGVILKYSNQAKDLGVVFDNKLSFTAHISKMVAKAKNKVFILYRCFKSTNIDCLLKAYCSYVLPILDYCSPIWSLCKVSEIISIESVQRIFTKRLAGLHNLSYSERLKELNLCSLELRRLRSDLLLCYKLCMD